MKRIFAIFVAGFIVLLPLVVTLALLVWIGGFINQFLGPHSLFGRMLISIGLGVTASSPFAYLLGVLVLFGMIFLMGLLVETQLRPKLVGFIDGLMARIPLVGTVYDTTKRFVSLVDTKDSDGIKSMAPVWCFFGGEGGAAVLCLLPTPTPIVIGGAPYHVVLAPSAPVPIGGCLIYVPAAWVKPAEVGVDELMSIYVTMGVSSPPRVDLKPLTPVDS
ncbi:MAG TPA: DUF502 domain-containing protein [Xanthobacteraceae bacterium]|jgi:uncharacterized membrane protein|nr:DUF502 domain-containing protein [Xanthobacteraceae bacterium]